MAKDKQKFDARNKHFPGELLRHKKHGYIVQLVGKRDFKRELKLIKGPVPYSSFTFRYSDEPGALGYVAPCTLNSQFESLGPAAKILFTDK